MYNLTIISNLMRYFLLIDGIYEIDLCVVGIEIHFHHLFFYLNYSNILRNVLYAEKFDVSQLITLNKNMII